MEFLRYVVFCWEISSMSLFSIGNKQRGTVFCWGISSVGMPSYAVYDALLTTDSRYWLNGSIEEVILLLEQNLICAGTWPVAVFPSVCYYMLDVLLDTIVRVDLKGLVIRDHIHLSYSHQRQSPQSKGNGSHHQCLYNGHVNQDSSLPENWTPTQGVWSPMAL
jgi:hypothetical protein